VPLGEGTGVGALEGFGLASSARVAGGAVVGDGAAEGMAALCACATCARKKRTLTAKSSAKKIRVIKYLIRYQLVRGFPQRFLLKNRRTRQSFIKTLLGYVLYSL